MHKTDTNYPDTYTLVWKKYIPEYKTDALYFNHNKSGAEVLVLENDDNNKVFGVSFKTIPEDDTGVAHILEHSVLAGSRKFTVKEPFVELIKTSLNTFVNASTYPDKTIYPVASQNEQDYYNLMDVYLDAVFFPLLKEDVLKQEGWHYEFDENDKLIIRGVVFNEMKGYLSNPDLVFYNAIQWSLFPDNLYKYEVGGEPAAIPQLTYEQFKKFHTDHYHPSNAKIYFYGNGDTNKNLSFLDEYLKEFDKVELNLNIEPQMPFTEVKTITEKYAVGKDVSLEKKSYISRNWVLNDLDSHEESLALDILEYALLSSDASPLQKSILDAGLAEDLTGGYDTSYVRGIFMLGAKGANESDLDKIENVIQETLVQFAEKIDRDLLESALNVIEFDLRENKSSRYPKGLAMFTEILCNWNYDRDPLEVLAFEEQISNIRTKLISEEKYFESLIKKYLLENKHSTIVRLNPDTNLLAQREEAERKVLDELQQKLTDAQKQEIREQHKKLKEWQESSDSPEELAKIPKLEISDLDKEIRKHPIKVESFNDTELVTHNLETNGIVYVDFGFELNTLPEKYWDYIQIYEEALLRLGTKSHSAEELALWTDKKIGGLGSKVYITTRVDNKDSVVSKFFIDAKVLKENFKDLVEILSERLFNINFDNSEKLLSILQESKSGYEAGFTSSGAAKMALSRSFAGLSLSRNLIERVSGLDHYFLLKELVQNFESKSSEVITILQEIHEHVINKNGLLINITANDEVVNQIRSELEKFINSLPKTTAAVTNFNFAKQQLNEGYTIPSEVNYNALSLDIGELGYESHGSTYAILNILYGSYLWNKVRVLGGAYGGNVSFHPLRSNIFGYVSWRDPNIEKTFDVFQQAGDYLKTTEFIKHDIDGAILGAIGDMDAYLNADERGWVSLDNYLAGVNDEIRQARRDELLEFGIEDIRNFSKILLKLKDYSKVVLGNKDKIKKANETLEQKLEIKPLL